MLHCMCRIPIRIVRNTYIVYGVRVSQRRPEVDHDVLPQDPGERLRSNPVSEDPPKNKFLCTKYELLSEACESTHQVTVTIHITIKTIAMTS